MSKNDYDDSWGCLLIIILFIIIAGLCTRVTNLENQINPPPSVTIEQTDSSTIETHAY